MQKVSEIYKESMKSSLRERAYIKIVFGLINQEAQANASVKDGILTYYSNENIFEQSESDIDITYATFEEDYTKIDGSMYFLPHVKEQLNYINTDLVSKNLISDGTFELTINLNITATDIKGFTIKFGENYPIEFDIVGENNTIEIRDNTTSEFRTEEILTDTTSVKFIFYQMKNEYSRVHIHSLSFGYILMYTNNSVMDSTLESYISPIAEDIPQIDFSVQLKNYDKYFNVDNPDSAINFLETGQEMEIYYGYQLPTTGEIEWIKGNHLLCSEWESDDYTATIKCQDVFRNMDNEYYKGVYNSQGTSFYDLAVAVLEDAGQSDYYIDDRLQELYSKNPIPKTESKQALQIIANACRCTLSQTRDGTISIKSNFIPEVNVSCNEQRAFSHVENILDNTVKQEYSMLNTDYTVVDGSMYFLPFGAVGVTLTTGFISDAISDESCEFTENPLITLTLESYYTYHGLKLIFGYCIPAAFIIRTYKDYNIIEEYTVQSEISKEMTIAHSFYSFDTMEIEFTKTEKPYNHIVLNNLSLGDIAEFTIERKDMLSSPKAIKQELVKEVIVPYYNYQKVSEMESVVNEDITVTSGDEVTYFVSEPCYGYAAYIDESTKGVKVISSGSYFITLRYSVSGTYQLEIKGYKYKISERYATVTLNDRGKSVKWENPMISDINTASKLAEWLADYYKAGVEYEYNTRGNPELDANDIIYQENDFHDEMKVNAYRVTLGFKQSFSGSVTARRIGE